MIHVPDQKDIAMQSSLTIRSLLATVVVANLALVSSCKSSGSKPPPADAVPVHAGLRTEITNDIAAIAEIVAVSCDKRVVTVRREDGSIADVEVAKSVPDLDKIVPGDAVKMRFRETLALEIVTPGTPAQPVQVQLGAARVPPGRKPGAGVGAALSMRVKIESIDEEHAIVVYSPTSASGSGQLHARRVRTPQGREFVRNLQVGDEVQVDYLEMLALQVTEL
jgi:hypothetical protein